MEWRAEQGKWYCPCCVAFYDMKGIPAEVIDIARRIETLGRALIEGTDVPETTVESLRDWLVVNRSRSAGYIDGVRIPRS